MCVCGGGGLGVFCILLLHEVRATIGRNGDLLGPRSHDKHSLLHSHVTVQLIGISIRLKYLLHLFKINCINIIYYLRTSGKTAITENNIVLHTIPDNCGFKEALNYLVYNLYGTNFNCKYFNIFRNEELKGMTPIPNVGEACPKTFQQERLPEKSSRND